MSEFDGACVRGLKKKKGVHAMQVPHWKARCQFTSCQHLRGNECEWLLSADHEKMLNFIVQDIHGEIWPTGLVPEVTNVVPTTGFRSSHPWQGDYWLAGFCQLKIRDGPKKNRYPMQCMLFYAIFSKPLYLLFRL